MARETINPHPGGAPLRVQFIGSGDAFGSGGRRQACVLVTTEGFRFLIDCGASSLPGLKDAGIDLREIDVIMVSHFHGDHFGGVPFFMVDAEVSSKRQNLLRIAGPRGLRRRLGDALEVFFPGSSRTTWSYPCDLVELPPGEPVRLGRLAVTAFPVAHFPGTEPHALRIEVSDRVIAYSGDTAWADGLVHAAAGADLLVCEALSYDQASRVHMDYRTLLAHRGELSCRRIVLTHMGPDLLARVGSLELESAADGMTIDL
jgi:ribonuclease BN (tRNA processing enzyme)